MFGLFAVFTKVTKRFISDKWIVSFNAYCMYSLSFVNQINTIFRPIKESVEKERIVGPGRGLGEPVTDLTLKENPKYLKTERGTRLFVLL